MRRQSKCELEARLLLQHMAKYAGFDSICILPNGINSILRMYVRSSRCLADDIGLPVIVSSDIDGLSFDMLTAYVSGHGEHIDVLKAIEDVTKSGKYLLAIDIYDFLHQRILLMHPYETIDALRIRCDLSLS